MINEQYFENSFLFFEKYLKQLKIPISIFNVKDAFANKVDMGLHHSLGLEQEMNNDLKIFLDKTIKPNTIYYVIDEFYCHYIIMELPDQEPPSLLSIGPFLMKTNGQNDIIKLLQQKNVNQQWLPILRNYFRNITCLPNEDGILAATIAFAEIILGENNFAIKRYVRGLTESLEPLALPPDPQKRSDMFSNIETFERMYAYENNLMNAVSQGQSNKARTILANIPLFTLEQRTEAIRNLKNHTIIMNTLLRKAAEYGGVHPLYIDQLSSSFARRIEDSTRSDNFLELWNEMVQKYCALVNTHTLNKYSPPIRKVIMRIDFDLSADLSLKANADYLNISPSYLSALFKEETGQTLTDYVNQKRMTYAAYLLTYTQTPISTIAQTCGILDDNYFTKLFKKYMHKTPSKYRKDYFVEQRDF